MSFQDIDASAVATLLTQAAITILDARDLNSFNNDHIPNAIPANDFSIEQLIKNNTKEQKVLVYCYLGNSSRDLCCLLGKLGFKNVYNLTGGYTAWKKFSQQKESPASDPINTWLSHKGFDPLNINDRIANANTPLMEAAKEGNLDVVKELLARGADADLVNADKNSALWFACFSNQLNVVKTLIASTGNINRQNVNGATCLGYAASSGKLEVVKLLVEAGADMHIATHDGFNALELAATAAILKYLKSVFAQTAVTV